MKKILHLSLLLTFSCSYAQQTLPIFEQFNYTTGTSIIEQGGWSNLTTAKDDALLIASPLWSIQDFQDCIGGALEISKDGDDPQLIFTPVPITGSIYASFKMKVTSLVTTQPSTYITYAVTGSTTSTPLAPTHFFSFGYATSGSTTTSYAGAVFIRRSSSTATNTFYLGINAGSNTALPSDIVWSPNLFTVGENIVVVTSFSYDNYTAKMWLNPTITTTEPKSTLITAARTTLLKPDRLRISQLNTGTTPFLIIDEIRAANNWKDATGATVVLGLSSQEIEGLSLYPNPVSNGSLFISSPNQNEKQVNIYSMLGQLVIESTTISGPINVSNLGKGLYLVKITDDEKSQIKKLIIK